MDDELLRPVDPVELELLVPVPVPVLVLPEPLPLPVRLAVEPALEEGDVAPRALLDVRLLVPVDVPVEPLTPEVPVEPPVEVLLTGEVPVVLDTPEHGATVAEVNEVELVGEISTPATLQLDGICCSMISTKLIGPELLAPLVVVVVVLVVEPVPVPAAPALEPVPAPEARALEPIPAPEAPALEPMPAPEAPVLEPAAAPEARAELEAPPVVVVVVWLTELADGAERMSMKATVWPLLLRLKNVPAIGVDAPLLVPVEVALTPDELEVAPVPLVPAPLALEPLALAKVPVH